MPQLIYDKEELDKQESYKRNLKWFRENYNTIKASHSGQFVAIYKEEVVGFNKDFMTLVDGLKKEHGDLSRFVIELINESNNICFVNSRK